MGAQIYVHVYCTNQIFLGPCIFHFLILTILEILYANKCIIKLYGHNKGSQVKSVILFRMKSKNGRIHKFINKRLETQIFERNKNGERSYSEQNCYINGKKIRMWTLFEKNEFSNCNRLVDYPRRLGYSNVSDSGNHYTNRRCLDFPFAERCERSFETPVPR